MYRSLSNTGIQGKGEKRSSLSSEKERNAANSSTNRKREGEEKDGSEQHVSSPLRPDAISGCVTAGGRRVQVAQMPQTNIHTAHELQATSHTVISKAK